MSQFFPETDCPKCRGDGWAHMGICHNEKVILGADTPYPGLVVNAEIYSDIMAIICDCNSPAVLRLRESNLTLTKAVLNSKIKEKYPKHEVMVYEAEKDIYRQYMQEKEAIIMRAGQTPDKGRLES